MVSASLHTEIAGLEVRLSLEGIGYEIDGAAILRDVSLELRSGEVTCLLGPSGCGKTSLLRIAAGVERQSQGKVRIAGRIVAGDGLFLPPERREVGLIFQDFALFPHLTVGENVAFGASGVPEARRQRAKTLLARVGLAGHLERYPHQLSGGEQQRVALARALAPRPPVLLMDEPFSGLDNRLRDGIREQTLEILREEGATVMMVTHDPEEAMHLADGIALMRGGRIVQSGTAYEIYNAPVDKEAAMFFSDVNVVLGTVRGGRAETPFGAFATPGLTDNAEVDIVIRPQHLKMDFDRNGRGPNPTASDGDPVRGIVVRARFIGDQSVVELRSETDGTALKATVPGVFLPGAGTPLWLSMRRDRCFVFPRGRIMPQSCHGS